MTAKRRVVVTGVGLVSPLGVGTEATWQALLEGQSGVGPITLFDASQHSTRFAAEVKGFDPLGWVEKKDVKKMDRFIQFAVAAADMAIADSGLVLDAANADRVGAFIGSGIGGFATIEREHETLLRQGPARSARSSSRPPSSTWPRAGSRSAPGPRGPTRPPAQLAPAVPMRWGTPSASSSGGRPTP